MHNTLLRVDRWSYNYVRRITKFGKSRNISIFLYVFTSMTFIATWMSYKCNIFYSLPKWSINAFFYFVLIHDVNILSFDEVQSIAQNQISINSITKSVAFGVNMNYHIGIVYWYMRINMNDIHINSVKIQHRWTKTNFSISHINQM